MELAEFRDRINNCFAWMTKNLADTYIYDWIQETKVKHINECYSKLENSLRKLIDWNNLTDEHCVILRFGKWVSMEEVIAESIPEIEKLYERKRITEEEYNYRKECAYRSAKIRLIPLYLYNLIPKDIQLYDLDGVPVEKGHHLDNDHRFGCLAYGIIPIDKQEKQ